MVGFIAMVDKLPVIFLEMFPAWSFSGEKDVPVRLIRTRDSTPATQEKIFKTLTEDIEFMETWVSKFEFMSEKFKNQ
eukprot:Pgem_evm1s5912